MTINLVGIIVLIIVCALIYWLVQKLVANPQIKNFIYLVLAIIAILVLLNFIGVIHLSGGGAVHIT
jgi:Co/Zn/Cd efflux system component